MENFTQHPLMDLFDSIQDTLLETSTLPEESERLLESAMLLNKRLTGFVGDTEEILLDAFANLKNVNAHILEKGMELNYGSLPTDLTQPSKEVVGAKLIKYASNIFCVSSLYSKDSQGLLTHDSMNFLYFLDMATKMVGSSVDAVRAYSEKMGTEYLLAKEEEYEPIKLTLDTTYLSRCGGQRTILKFRKDARWPYADEFGGSYTEDGYVSDALSPSKDDLVAEMEVSTL